MDATPWKIPEDITDYSHDEAYEMGVSAGAEWARKQTLAEASEALMAAGDARSKKASAEQERGRSYGRDEPRKAELAHDHAWALRNQADGLWEAAHAIRALGTPQTQEETH